MPLSGSPLEWLTHFGVHRSGAPLVSCSSINWTIVFCIGILCPLFAFLTGFYGTQPPQARSEFRILMNPGQICQPSILPKGNFVYTNLEIPELGMEIPPGVPSFTQPFIKH